MGMISKGVSVLYLVEESKGEILLYDENSNLCEFDLNRDDIYGKNNIVLGDIDRVLASYTVFPIFNKEWFFLKTLEEVKKFSKDQSIVYMKKELAGFKSELYSLVLKEVEPDVFGYTIYNSSDNSSTIQSMFNNLVGDKIKCLVVNDITKEKFISAMLISTFTQDGRIKFKVEHNACSYFTVYNLGMSNLTNGNLNFINMSILFRKNDWYCKLYRQVEFRSKSVTAYVKLFDLFKDKPEIEYEKKVD